MAFQICRAAAAAALLLGGSVSAEPQGTATLFKIVAGECAQVDLDEKFEAVAAKFAGLQEGTCADQGYPLAAGSKDITVPGLGQLKVALYKKPALLAILEKGLSPALFGASEAAGRACCHACVKPMVKYYSIDTSHGHCGECCMNPSHYHIFKVFEPNLTLANGKSCRWMGYPKYDSTVTHGLYPLSMTLDLYDPRRVEAQEVTLHKVHDGVCAELTLQESAITRAASLVGLASGSCKDQGFTVDAGSADLAPVPARVRLALPLDAAPPPSTSAEPSSLLEELAPALERLGLEGGLSLAREEVLV